MKAFLEKKTIGFIFVPLAVIMGLISFILFVRWAPQHNEMDMLILIPLIVAVLADFWLFKYENDWVQIISTVCYGVSVFRLLTNSVGSFVDAFQGIKMFGDATQVGTILTISKFILAAAAFSIIASFAKLNKQ